jgi:hypothetical protein
VYIPKTLITASELNGFILVNLVTRTLRFGLWQVVVEQETDVEVEDTYLTIVVLDTVDLILSFG